MRRACRVNRTAANAKPGARPGFACIPPGGRYSIASAAFSVADGRIAADSLPMSGW